MPAKPRKAAKFYAVTAGRATGVFRSWDECQRSVNGFSGASFKAFTTSEEAKAFVVRGGGGGVNAASMTTKLPSSSSKRARPSSIAAAVAGAAGDDSDAPTDATAGASSSKKKPREEEKGIEAVTTSTSTTPSPTFKQLADPQSLYALFFDGAARGNHVQGRGAIGGAGAVLYRVREEDGIDDETFSNSNSSKLLSEVGRLCVPLGTATNNAAEWAALELGLAASAATGVRRLRALGDSKLVINQLSGEWKTKEPALAAARRRAAALVAAGGAFSEFEARHVFREANGVADALSNEALDSGGWEGWKTPDGEVHAWRNLELRGGGGGGGEEDEEKNDGGGAGAPAPPSSSSSPPPPPPPPSRRGGSGPSKRFDWSARALFSHGGNNSGRRRGLRLFPAATMTLPLPPSSLLLLQRPLSPPQHQLRRAFASPAQRRMMTLPSAPSMRLILRAAKMALL